MTTLPDDYDKGMFARYIQTRDAARKRRLRNQRLGDAALATACVWLGWILVHIISGAWR